MNLADELFNAESNPNNEKTICNLYNTITECSEMTRKVNETLFDDTSQCIIRLSLALSQIDDTWIKTDKKLVELILLMQYTSARLVSASLSIERFLATTKTTTVYGDDINDSLLSDNDIIINHDTLDEIDNIPSLLQEIQRQHYNIEQELPVVADSIQGFNQKSHATIRQACQLNHTCKDILHK